MFVIALIALIGTPTALVLRRAYAKATAPRPLTPLPEMPDKYDLAVRYLEENPKEIDQAWRRPREHKAGCLFQFAARRLVRGQGCLTMVRAGRYVAETPELTKVIRSDRRIPKSNHPKLKHLPVFAEWQRRLDKELCRP